MDFDELFVYTMSFEIESENLNFPLHLVGLANYTIYIKNCESFAQAIKKERGWQDNKTIRSW